jgi:hypothetical protein
MSPLTMLTVFGGVVCGWALLSVLSGERSRCLRQMEIDSAPVEPVDTGTHAPTPPPKKPPTKPLAPAPARAAAPAAKAK